MTNKKKAKYRGIPCYFYPDKDNLLVGRNWFYDKLLNIEIWFDINIWQIEMFPIEVEED